MLCDISSIYNVSRFTTVYPPPPPPSTGTHGINMFSVLGVCVDKTSICFVFVQYGPAGIKYCWFVINKSCKHPVCIITNSYIRFIYAHASYSDVLRCKFILSQENIGYGASHKPQTLTRVTVAISHNHQGAIIDHSFVYFCSDTVYTQSIYVTVFLHFVQMVSQVTVLYIISIRY